MSSREPAIIAPLSGRACVMWSLAIEQQVFRPPGSPHPTPGKHWLQRLADQGVAGFDLEDGPDRANVAVTRLIVWARRDVVRRETPFGAFGTLRQVLDRYDDVAAPLPRAKGPLRALEGVMRAGDVIAVEGVARWTDVEAPPSSRSYRTPGRSRGLVIEPDDDDAVHASNNPERPY